MPQPTVLSVLEDYRRRVLARDEVTRRDLVRRWLAVEEALEDTIEALVREMAEARAAGRPVTVGMLSQSERYRSLLAQAQEQMRRYSRYAEGLISREQYQALQEGIDLGAATIRAAGAQAGIDVLFDVLDAEAVNVAIGYAADGSPLSQLLMRAYPDTVTRITDTLVRGVALGWNPRKTARAMRDDMAGNAQRAMVVARTEQLRALRTANVREYQASGVVQYYRRRAARTARTCLACLLEDGRLYPVGTQFSDHPNGRCFAEPVLEGAATPFRQTGRQWFEGQNESVQRLIMGDARYEAWRGGEFRLEQAARMSVHPIWGEAPQVVPLEQLVGQQQGGGFALAAAG